MPLPGPGCEVIKPNGLHTAPVVGAVLPAKRARLQTELAAARTPA